MPGPLPSAAPTATPPEVIAPATPSAPPAAVLPPSATADPPVPITEKVIGAGLVAVPNMAVAQYASPEVNGLAGAIGVLVEFVKNFKAFPERWLTIPLLVLLSFGVAWFLWHDNVVEAVSRGAWVLTQSHLNWIGGRRLGVFHPTRPENKF